METQLREHPITYAKHNIPIGIPLVQIDNLDQFRASQGPDVVLTILRTIARSAENCVRPTDVVGCSGENQFIAILLRCRESQAAPAGEPVRSMIGQSEFEWRGDMFSVTSPGGGAGCRPEDSVELLIARAAASVEESIGKGGNYVTFLS